MAGGEPLEVMSEPAVVGLTALQQPYSVAERARDADAAFNELYVAVLPRIYAFVRTQVTDVHAAQEIVSRIFLKAFLHRRKIPHGDMATIWLFRIAHNTVIDHWRVDHRRASASVPLDEIAGVRAEQADPEQQYALKERQELLLRVMGDLPEEERTLLSWKFAAQRTNREVAQILSISEAAVSMRLLRALRRLRKRLGELGLA